MITNESFLENVKKIMSAPASSDSFINLTDLVEKFQEERLERVLSKNLTENKLFEELFSGALNEMMENQADKNSKFVFESTAQHYTTSSLVAFRLKVQKELNEATDLRKEDLTALASKVDTEVEILLNTEKKNSHKFHTLMHDYVKDSQEFLYDHVKLATKGRSMPSIEERIKEYNKNKETKKYNVQELEHPKIDAQQFEKEMKLLLSGDIKPNQIESALERVGSFQLGFISTLKKKINNPTAANEKLLPSVLEADQLKSLKDWSWEDESVNMMNKVLKTIKKASNGIMDLSHTQFEDVKELTEKLESIMLDIGSLKKYNNEVKEDLNSQITFNKKSNGLKM